MRYILHSMNTIAFEEMSPRLEGLIAEVEQELASDTASETFTSVGDFLDDLKK